MNYSDLIGRICSPITYQIADILSSVTNSMIINKKKVDRINHQNTYLLRDEKER